MRCPKCKSENIRHARLRLFDLPKLFVLNSPVRCRKCRKRWYAFMPAIPAQTQPDEGRDRLVLTEDPQES